jgi:cytoskeletal protein CcmA (bactofilin family)
MSKDFKDVETIIGSTVKIEGDFKGEGDIIVEGIVEGTLKTRRNLKVGEAAKIKAGVEASNAYVAGEILGDLKIAESLELTPSAKVTGDVEAKILTVATGAQINGQIKMGGEMTVEKVEEKEEKKK